MRESRDVAVDGRPAAPIFLGRDDLAGLLVPPRLASGEGFCPAGVARCRDGIGCYLGDALAGKLLGPPVELKSAGGALHIVELHQTVYA